MNKDLFFVGLQFLLFAAYFMDFPLLDFTLPTWIGYCCLAMFILGVVIIILGIVSLNDNITPFPTPKKSSDLISNGIYGLIRHPIYSGIFLSMFCYALYSGSGFRLLVAALMLLVFYYKSDYEESLLLARYKRYQSYKEKTGRFFPKKSSR